MSVLLLVALPAAVLLLGGRAYSRFIARQLGEDPTRPTPALRLADGRDYVATPTPVVFAHHFAAIAGAGPIVGPVLAMIYGWLPALLWVVFGGMLIGALHDYLVLYMATREDGLSVATIARRMLGDGVFVALVLFLVVMLALVCATFLNLSATALVSMLPFKRLEMDPGQSLFRVIEKGGRSLVVIGGIASTSVILITAAAPLVGWMYMKRKTAVWKCSVVAMAVCLLSVYIGVYCPIALPEKLKLAGWSISGTDLWKLLLSAYVLAAAGVPVWLFLQSRDYINAHILYAGVGAMMLSLLVAGFRGQAAADPIPALNLQQGGQAAGFLWPAMFITVACGAVSGFHSLCASGTTCKQITDERAARRIGYWAMLLETFVAVGVIAVLVLAAGWRNYVGDVYPKLLWADPAGESNAVLAFAVAMGKAANLAWGAPIAYGALAGMVLLEGFLVTTLDAAVRLTRYLIEEMWRTAFGRYDVFAAPVGVADAQAEFTTGEDSPAGADGIPIAPPASDSPPAPSRPIQTSGLPRAALKLLRRYWVNSGLAVALMLGFALSGGATMIWPVFATANQLLAAIVLSIGALWLLRRGKKAWYVIVPAVFMLATTFTSLLMLLRKFWLDRQKAWPLLLADAVIILLTLYLFSAGAVAAAAYLRRPLPKTAAIQPAEK